MATEIVEPAAAPDPSEDITLDDGARITLIPRPIAEGGRISVGVKDSADQYHTILTTAKVEQLIGPMTIRVTARNAGCDADFTSGL